MSGKTKLAVTLAAALLWGMFFLIGYKNLDPDFGWHLQVGRILWNKGIPETDPFSYTMPDWRWVDHGRWSDMAIAWGYEHMGMAGLAAIAAGMVILTLAILLPGKLLPWSAVPLLLGAGVLFTRSGVRPQVTDWLALATLLRLRNSLGLWRRLRWLVPVGFAVWANLHGGFVMGLGILGVDLALGWWKQDSRNPKDTAVWILAALATLVTPYGFGLWEEVWLTMSDAHLRTSIVEWQPFFVKLDLGYWFLAGLILMVIRIAHKQYHLSRLTVVVLLFLAGVSSLRNMPFFILAAIPLAADWMKNIYEELKTDPELVRRGKMVYRILLGIGITVFIIEVGTPMWKTLTGKWIRYPEAAVEHLKAGQISGRLFSEYAWGGYLIWKLPEQKVFIDGRMPSWRRHDQNGNIEWAFKDYEKIVNGDFAEMFQKYGIKTVLWSKETRKPKPGWLEETILGRKPQGKLFGEELQKNGWKTAYEDDLAVIYLLPDPVPVDKKE